MLRVNWQRGVYLALFFCNAVFATLFRSLGDGARLLSTALRIMETRRLTYGVRVTAETRRARLVRHVPRL